MKEIGYYNPYSSKISMKPLPLPILCSVTFHASTGCVTVVNVLGLKTSQAHSWKMEKNGCYHDLIGYS